MRRQNRSGLDTDQCKLVWQVLETDIGVILVDDQSLF